jgi:L-2,4-diaminobutyrate decarboxylase
MSNTVAVYLALQRARARGSRFGRGLCVVTTDQAHLSIEKATALVGLPKEAVLRVPTDAAGRLVPGTLHEVVVRHGGDPFLCVCTAGTTSAGVLEPAEEFLAIARAHGAWCHIDAAYGGFVSLTGARRQHVAQWREADSISWDAHKSLHASYSAGALLLRDDASRQVLRSRGAYALKGNGAADAGDDHFEGSRRMEALKLWMCIRHLGTTGYAALADRMLVLASHLALQIHAREELELLTDPDTGIVCFRYHSPSLGLDELNRVNRSIQQQLFLRGGPLLSSTRIGERDVLRAVLLNPRTTPADFMGVIDRVVEAGRRNEARIRSQALSSLAVVST